MKAALMVCTVPLIVVAVGEREPAMEPGGDKTHLLSLPDTI